MKLRILLVDDHQIIREGLRLNLSNHSDIEIVSEADSSLDALDKFHLFNPDMVIMDVSLSDSAGFDLTYQIKKINPEVKIIAFTMHKDKTTIKKMFDAGVSGYILKESDTALIYEAIMVVNSGNTYVSPEIINIIINNFTSPSSSKNGTDKIILTEKEIRVVKYIAEGKSTKEIAYLLNKSIKSINLYKNTIMDKLGIDNLAGLIKYAIQTGITEN